MTAVAMQMEDLGLGSGAGGSGSGSSPLLGAEFKAAAQSLYLDGLVVVPLYATRATLEQINGAFVGALNAFPEYLNPQFDIDDTYNVNTEFVRGQDLANPASFHNLAVRRIRRDFNAIAVPLIYHQLDAIYRGASSGGGGAGWRGVLESKRETKTTAAAAAATASIIKKQRFMFQSFDQMSITRKGSAVAAEEWHREATPGDDTDTTISGIINLDLDGNQRLSYVKGSHRLFCDGNNGPSKETKKSIKATIQNLKQDEAVIPPGHICLFYRSMLHAAKGTRGSDVNSLRQYVSATLTNAAFPRVFAEYGDDIQERIRDQAVMKLPNLRDPVMWHILAQEQGRKVEQWSVSTFQPACIHQVTQDHGEMPKWAGPYYGRGATRDWDKDFEAKHVPLEVPETKKFRIPATGGGFTTEARQVIVFRITYNVVDRVMTSLRDYGLPLYPAYSAYDLNMMTPSSYEALAAGQGSAAASAKAATRAKQFAFVGGAGAGAGSAAAAASVPFGGAPGSLRYGSSQVPLAHPLALEDFELDDLVLDESPPTPSAGAGAGAGAGSAAAAATPSAGAAVGRFAPTVSTPTPRARVVLTLAHDITEDYKAIPATPTPSESAEAAAVKKKKRQTPAQRKRAAAAAASAVAEEVKGGEEEEGEEEVYATPTPGGGSRKRKRADAAGGKEAKGEGQPQRKRQRKRAARKVRPGGLPHFTRAELAKKSAAELKDMYSQYLKDHEDRQLELDAEMIQVYDFPVGASDEVKAKAKADEQEMQLEGERMDAQEELLEQMLLRAVDREAEAKREAKAAARAAAAAGAGAGSGSGAGAGSASMELSEEEEEAEEEEEPEEEELEVGEPQQEDKGALLEHARASLERSGVDTSAMSAEEIAARIEAGENDEARAEEKARQVISMRPRGSWLAVFEFDEEKRAKLERASRRTEQEKKEIETFYRVTQKAKDEEARRLEQEAEETRRRAFILAEQARRAAAGAAPKVKRRLQPIAVAAGAGAEAEGALPQPAPSAAFGAGVGAGAGAGSGLQPALARTPAVKAESAASTSASAAAVAATPTPSAGSSAKGEPLDSEELLSESEEGDEGDEDYEAEEGEGDQEEGQEGEDEEEQGDDGAGEDTESDEEMQQAPT
jgi:hypothetical protein